MCISLVGKLADSYQIVQKSLKSAIVKNAPCFSAQIDIYGVPDNYVENYGWQTALALEHFKYKEASFHLPVLYYNEIRVSTKVL